MPNLIRTERLVLRPLTLDDVDALHDYQSREDVCRYIPYLPRSRELIAELITSGAYPSSVSDEGQALTLGVTLAGDDRVIGDVMLAWRSREHGTGEIGYVLNPRHQGHGYATEAAAALLPLAFETYRLHRVIARVDARNEASANVLRRLGMRQESLLRENEWFKGEWTDEIDFGLLASEWASSRDEHEGPDR